MSESKSCCSDPECMCRGMTGQPQPPTRRERVIARLMRRGYTVADAVRDIEETVEAGGYSLDATDEAIVQAVLRHRARRDEHQQGDRHDPRGGTMKLRISDQFVIENSEDGAQVSAGLRHMMHEVRDHPLRDGRDLRDHRDIDVLLVVLGDLVEAQQRQLRLALEELHRWVAVEVEAALASGRDDGLAAK